MIKSIFQKKIDRSKAPNNNLMPKINLKKPAFFKLDNGLTVLVIENHKLPIVKIKLEFDRELILEKDKAGMQEILAGMLRSGTKNYKKEELEDIIDNLGSTIHTSSSRFYLSTLKKNINKSIEVFSDILFNSTLNNVSEFKRLKKQEIANIKISEKDIDIISERIRKFLTFGKDHPYGEYSSKKTIDNINIDDLQNFYKKYFKPNKAYIIFVGDIKKSHALALCKKYFSSWKNNIKNENIENTIQSIYKKNNDIKKIEIFFIDMPHVNQSNISIFKSLDFKKNFSDYHSAIIANGILGGGIQSRICQNLREDKGYTYGAYSILEDNKYLGNFFISAQVKDDVTYDSIKELIKEINRMSYDPVSEEELKLKKNELYGKFLLKLENYDTIASLNINLLLDKLPTYFYQNYINNIQSVSIENIIEASKKYIEPNKYKILVVGNSNKILSKIKNLEYQINIIDKYGNFLKKY